MRKRERDLVQMIVNSYCEAHNESMVKTDHIAVLNTKLQQQEAGESDQIQHANSMMGDAKIPEAARWETRLQALIDDRDDLREQLEEVLDDLRLVNNALSGSQAPSAPIHKRVEWLVLATRTLAQLNIIKEAAYYVALDGDGAGGRALAPELNRFTEAVDRYIAQRKELGI